MTDGTHCTNGGLIDAGLRFGHEFGSLFTSDAEWLAAYATYVPAAWSETWTFDMHDGWRRLGPPCSAPFTLDLVDVPIIPIQDTSDQHAPASDQLAPPIPFPPPHNPADVLQKIYMSDADDKLPPGVLQLLTRYLERDEEDRRNGRTREHHEKMLQRVIDEQQAMRLEMTRRDGVVDNQFTELRVRQAGLETTVGKLDERVGKLEGKVEDVSETTGNFQIDTLTATNKRNEKWWFLVGGALIAAALTVAGDLVIHALSPSRTNETPVHVESPAK